MSSSQADSPAATFPETTTRWLDTFKNPRGTFHPFDVVYDRAQFDRTGEGRWLVLDLENRTVVWHSKAGSKQARSHADRVAREQAARRTAEASLNPDPASIADAAFFGGDWAREQAALGMAEAKAREARR